MKYARFFLLMFTLSTLALAAPGCNRKSGCPAQESLKPPTNKKGEITGKRRKAKSKGLFPKDVSRKMR
jgi:hypothetical protein